MNFDEEKVAPSLYDPYSVLQLHLPSFDVLLHRSEPTTVDLPKGQGGEKAVDSGDSYSVSHLPGGVGFITRADREFMGLELAHVRRLLIKVLDEEEYRQIIIYHEAREHTELDEAYYSLPVWEQHLARNYFNYLRTVSNEDRRAQIRITDLRLARDLRPVELKRAPLQPDLAPPALLVRRRPALEVRDSQYLQDPPKKPEKWTESEAT